MKKRAWLISICCLCYMCGVFAQGSYEKSVIYWK